MTRHARWLMVPVLLVLAHHVACRTGGGGDGQATGIGPEGGDVSFGSVTIEVEPGTFAEETIIEIQRTTAAPAGHIGAAYDFGPEGVTFSPPVTLRFGYSAGILGETDPADLRIATAVDGVWVPVESVVDTEVEEVRASLTHFSIYGLVDIDGPTDGDADVDSDSDTDVDSDSDTDVDSDVDSDSDTDVDSDSDSDVDSDSDADADCYHGTCTSDPYGGTGSAGECDCTWYCGDLAIDVHCEVGWDMACDCDEDGSPDCFMGYVELDLMCGDETCCSFTS